MTQIILGGRHMPLPYRGRRGATVSPAALYPAMCSTAIQTPLAGQSIQAALLALADATQRAPEDEADRHRGVGALDDADDCRLTAPGAVHLPRIMPYGVAAPARFSPVGFHGLIVAARPNAALTCGSAARDLRQTAAVQRTMRSEPRWTR
jgi:hypothetical protein